MSGIQIITMKYYFLFIYLISTTLLFAQQKPISIPLWPNGAPGFENRKNEAEQAQDWWVKNIHHPSVTVFLPPKDKANGTAVVICPGGGHRALVYQSEGQKAAEYFNSLGITAFVLKYRLFREENSPYKEGHAKQDGYRAMRLVRSRAKEWNIDPTRIGVMGFSAGGELAAWISYGENKSNPNADDAIDKVSALPDFQVLIYPGPLAVPAAMDEYAPPSFLLAANDDECCSEPIMEIAQLCRKAKVPVEVHLFSQGQHAFNMGSRSTLESIKDWPKRLTDWLSDNGWLETN